MVRIEHLDSAIDTVVDEQVPGPVEIQAAGSGELPRPGSGLSEGVDLVAVRVDRDQATAIVVGDPHMPEPIEFHAVPTRFEFRVGRSHATNPPPQRAVRPELGESRPPTVDDISTALIVDAEIPGDLKTVALGAAVAELPEVLAGRA